MYKLLKLSRNVCRLSETIVNKSFINNSNIISSINNQFVGNYCTEGQKLVDTHLPGLESDINVEILTQNDPELLKKLQLIILEVDVMRQEGSLVPESSSMKQQHWQEMLTKTSRSQRRKYLEFLFKIEKKKENQKNKRQEARIDRENRPDYVGDGHIRYGLNHNTIFIRIYDTTINQLYNSKLIQAHQFGQPLVIDCGYDQQMTTRECHNCAKQLMLAFGENRIHDEPFDLHLCNAYKSSPTISALNRHIVTLYEPWFPLSVHEESYLSTTFPSLKTEHNSLEEQKKKLVYLTPHCREEMKEFDHDAVYILGGIVDKINQEPLSLAKAKREGIRMQKLPLDRYLSWGGGSGKSLTLNQMILILLDIRRSGDWNYALRHVPRRKILEPNAILKNADQHALRFDRSRNSNNLKTGRSTRDLINELMKN